MKKIPQKVLILGLGLMGGSLAAALKRKFPKVKIAAVSRSRQALVFARRRGWIDEGSAELSESLCLADLAVLCTPVDTEAAQLSKLEKLSEQPLLVTDVGSVKHSLSQWVLRQKFRKIRFVGAHPMVGSHEQGVKASRENLYQGGLVFLVHSADQKKTDFLTVKNFWKSLGMHPSVVSSEVHDAIVGDISHLPHAAAVCLMNSVAAGSLKFAATGFRDTTRVSAGHPSIWIPIFLENSKVIDRALGTFEKEIRSFRKVIRSKDSKRVQEKLFLASQKRQEI